MCGRFSLDTDINDLFFRYSIIEKLVDFKPREEVFPSQLCPVVLNDGENKIREMKWGIGTSFSKKLIINARSETVYVKPTFKDSFLNRRCIIPATSYYEWEKVDDKKVKKRIGISGEDIISLAGIYNNGAFTILTTDAHRDILYIHNRMPVIIPAESEGIWLDNEIKDISLLKQMLKPMDFEYKVE